MKTRWLVLGLALCLVAAPAQADLVGFTVSNPMTTFNGTNFFQSADFYVPPSGPDDAVGTAADLYRNITPTGTASWDIGAVSTQWTGSSHFEMSLTISNLTATTADGAGTFLFRDVDGDSLSGSVNGDWLKLGSIGIFNGTLGNVTFTPAAPGNNTFDGFTGSVSMLFNSSQPWNGGVTEILDSGLWFAPDRSFRQAGGSIDATVVPVPAALLLGLLGMSVAGLKLRKFA